MTDSLYRNSTYLLINLLLTAISGFLFVLVCTHFYSQKEFGYATSLIGATMLATSISNIGMNRTIVRFLGKSDRKSQDFVTHSLIVISCSLFVGSIMSIFLDRYGIKHVSPILILIYIASVLTYSLKYLFDNVFVATRSAVGTLIENSAFNIVKIIFPLIVIGSGFVGILSAQLAAAIISIVVSLYLLQTRFNFKIITKPQRESMSGKWQFAFGSYTADLIGGLPTSILPIIVVAKLGPVAGALWYVVIQIINFLLTLSNSINQAMFAEMANSTEGIGKFIKKALLAMYGLVIPSAIFVIIFAPIVLRLFSGNYTNATHLLRLMTLFAMAGIINYITGSILAYHKKVFYITIVNAVNASVVIFYCLLAAHNLTGIAIGWMLGEVANLILFVGGAYFLIDHDWNLNVIQRMSK
jgi:O-antigen/teichoic acid export membrane protein